MDVDRGLLRQAGHFAWFVIVEPNQAQWSCATEPPVGAASDWGASLHSRGPYFEVALYLQYLGANAVKFIKSLRRCPALCRKAINASASSFDGIACSQLSAAGASKPLISWNLAKFHNEVRRIIGHFVQLQRLDNLDLIASVQAQLLYDKSRTSYPHVFPVLKDFDRQLVAQMLYWTELLADLRQVTLSILKHSRL